MAIAALPSTRTEELIAQLRLICGRDHVFTDAATLQTFSADALAHYRQSPLVAVMPGTAAECHAVLRACARAEVPFVTRGAATGLAGGVLPFENSVVIGLGRLRRILAVDLAAGSVVAEAGVTAAEIERAVAPTHHYPPLSATAAVATLGGNVATNAGSPIGPGGGATGDFITGLDVLLADGTELELRAGRPGIDLTGAFLGSGGTLGIVVRVHLRILPAPAQRLLVRADFPDVIAAAEAGTQLLGAGIGSASVEVLESDTLTQALGGRRSAWLIAGDPKGGHSGVLLAELTGSRAQCKRDGIAAVEVFRDHGATTMRITADPPHTSRLSTLRAAIVPSATGLPAYYLSDVVVPVSSVTRVLGELAQASEQAKLNVVSLIRPLIGSILSKIAYDPTAPGQAAAARELATRLAAVGVAAGGTVGGEHGIGVDKLDQLAALRPLEDLDFRRAVKLAFDPAGQANPDKHCPARTPPDESVSASNQDGDIEPPGTTALGPPAEPPAAIDPNVSTND